ncbi:trimethylamine-N-oxide reductase 1 precursor [Roseovarius sp. A-2]|nr:trimethylamine-N-oxide reductase 1 precursor [Roseovarius sp. A-2]
MLSASGQITPRKWWHDPAFAKLRKLMPTTWQYLEMFNDRGRCLAGARITDEIQSGSVFLWTGAWYDPDFTAPQARDRHGNPNVLTHDLRTSSLTQSPAAHSALVQLQRFDGSPPPVKAHEPPTFEPEP